jgi:hypothetical protein
MSNPSHKQKKSQEPDAPKWYIDAYLEALEIGSAIVLINSNQDAEHIPLARYPELIDALQQKHQKHTSSQNK